MSIFHKKSIHGFTLLEMIVSMGIFAVVAVIAVGALVKITGLNRQAQSLQSAMTNLNFGLESISREMRVGTDYHCETSAGGVTLSSAFLNTLTSQACDLSSGSSYIVFKSSKQAPDGAGSFCQLAIVYWFESLGSGSSITYSLRRDQQASCNDSLVEAEAAEMLDPSNVTLQGYYLSVYAGGARKYSWARFRLNGYAGTKASEKSSFDVRTLVSQRIADL